MLQGPPSKAGANACAGLSPGLLSFLVAMSVIIFNASALPHPGGK